MQTRRFRRIARDALVATALAAAASVAHAQASTEPSGLDPELAAKVARERAKQGRRTAEMNSSSSSRDRKDDAGCGQVDIGNDDSGRRGGANRVAERNRTVIVTGNVINAARCR